MPTASLPGSGGLTDATNASTKLLTTRSGGRCVRSGAASARSTSTSSAAMSPSKCGCFAECQIGFAGEHHRALVRPVLERDVVQRRRGRRRPDRAAGVPRIAHHPLAARQRGADRPRQRNGAVELRHAAIERERAVDVGGQRVIGRIDAEPDLEPARIAAAAGNSIAVGFVAGDERSFPPERPKQRADVAVERELLQRQARARRGIGENDAAVFDAQPRDGQIFRAPSARGAPASRWRRNGRARDRFAAQPGAPRWLAPRRG